MNPAHVSLGNFRMRIHEYSEKKFGEIMQKIKESPMTRKQMENWKRKNKVTGVRVHDEDTSAILFQT